VTVHDPLPAFEPSKIQMMMTLFALLISGASAGEIGGFRAGFGAGLGETKVGTRYVTGSNTRVSNRVLVAAPSMMYISAIRLGPSSLAAFGGVSDWGPGVANDWDWSVTLTGGLEANIRVNQASLPVSGQISKRWSTTGRRVSWEARMAPAFDLGPFTLSLAAAVGGEPGDDSLVIAFGSVPDFNGSGQSSGWAEGLPVPTLAWRANKRYELGLYLGITLDDGSAQPAAMIGYGHHW
jgi:hypothetical protein